MNDKKQTPVFRQAEVVAKDIRRYWEAYGKSPGILTSPYFLASVIFTVLMAPGWLRPEWWNDVIAAAPSLLGFSLGGMALLLAFGNDRFKNLLAQAGGDTPRFLSLSASFVHFILTQTFALLAALFCKAWYAPPPPAIIHTAVAFGLSESGFISFTHIVWGPAYFLFIYSILCAVAATFRIFNITRTFVMVVRSDAQTDPPSANLGTLPPPASSGSSSETSTGSNAP